MSDRRVLRPGAAVGPPPEDGTVPAAHGRGRLGHR